MRDLLANKLFRSFVVSVAGGIVGSVTLWLSNTDLGAYGPFVGVAFAWLVNTVKVWWENTEPKQPTDDDTPKIVLSIAALLTISAVAYAAPRATIDGPADKPITLTVAVAGSEPVTITLPAGGASPPPVVPVPPVVPPVVPVTPDTMGMRLRVIAAAKVIADPAGAATLAAKAEGLAAKIRAGAGGNVQGVANEIASAIKAAGPKWNPLLSVVKAALVLLIESGKLSATDVQTWATLLEEIAAALREAAQ